MLPGVYEEGNEMRKSVNNVKIKGLLERINCKLRAGCS